MKRLVFDPNDIIQQKSKDKFSFPFNGEGDVAAWIDKVKEYEYFIHDIYFACPNISNFFSRRSDTDYPDKCIELCKLLNKYWPVRKCIVLNDPTPKSLSELKNIAKSAIEFIDEYNIHSCVVSNFDIARILAEERPNVELITSCNVPQYYISSLDNWRDYANITLVNPNRPISRNIPYLKKLKKAGYRIKLLINEDCNLLCPNYVCAGSVSDDFICTSRTCNLTPLQSCTLLPRWLNELDEYCEIFKLTGRLVNLAFTLNQLELYIMRTDDCYYHELHAGCQVPILCKDIPDYLLHCGYTNCKTCGKCRALMEKFAKQYLDSLPKFVVVK